MSHWYKSLFIYIYIVVEYTLPGCRLLVGVKMAIYVKYCKIAIFSVNQHMTFTMKQECFHPKALKWVHRNVDSWQTMVILIAQAVYNSFMASVKKVCLHISVLCIDEEKLFIHVQLVIILLLFNINFYLDILSQKIENMAPDTKPVLASGYCRRLRLSIRVSINPELVCLITQHPFKLESPNLGCNWPWPPRSN